MVRNRTALVIRAFIVVVIAVAASMLSSGPASAHAILLSSSPADGADLAAAPGALVLTFDEDVVADTATATLYSGVGQVAAGKGQSGGGLSITSKPGQLSGSTDLVIALPPLSAGAYAVAWQVQSADDLHRTDGSTAFGVGQVVSTSAADRSGSLPDPISTAVHWADLAALSMMLGSILLGLVVVPRSGLAGADRRRWQRGLRSVARWSAAAALFLGVATLVDASDITRVPDVLVTEFGTLWLLHVLGLLGVLVVSRRPWVGRVRHPLGAVAVLVAVTGLAAISHVATTGDRPVATVLLALHLTAGCCWVGAVALLCAAALVRTVRAEVPCIAKAFGIPAAIGVAVVATTGLALGARQVASADALLASTYGRILLVKLVLVGAAGLLGLLTAIRLRQPGGSRRTDRNLAVDNHRAEAMAAHRSPRRLVLSLTLEAGSLLLVLAAAAALSLSAAPRGAAFAPTVAADQTQLSAQVDDLLLTLDLSPGAVGQNWARLTVDDTRRPAPAPIAAVTLALSGPSGQQLTDRNATFIDNATGWRLDGIAFAEAGPWQVSVTVHRPGRPDAVWSPQWTVGGGPLGVAKPTISDQPWANLLNQLAVALAAACIAIVVISTRRRRPATGSEPADREPVDRESADREPVDRHAAEVPAPT